MRRFEDKTALVTGGASGIGAATAIKLATEGAQVIVVDRNVEKGTQVLSQIHELGETAFFQEVDLTDEASIALCADAVVDRVSALHVLVNNAGISRSSAIEDVNSKDWEIMVPVNLYAPVLMTRALLPLMKKEGGAIVNISSSGPFRPRAGKWVYDVTKVGIWTLTRTMAVEFSPYGIRVNTVAPGWTVTEMHFAEASEPEERKRELEGIRSKNICVMGRLGRPEEIANAIAFLASDEASFITATTLHVDGGLVAN
ncbi:SDR family NAD(P)-dependent oxidoreductase [Candidatus Poribacteria bacterium]